MREIQFRGKHVGNRGWFYGSYFYNHFDKSHYIKTLTEGGTQYEDIKVDPETVGQYTGLKDKNGVEMFEGDKYNWYGSKLEIPFEGVVKDIRNVQLDRFDSNEYEVIGNIHENK